jgi:hypothetical protein
MTPPGARRGAAARRVAQSLFASFSSEKENSVAA